MKEIKNEMAKIEKLFDKVLEEECGEMPEEHVKNYMYLYMLNNQDFTKEIDVKALFESIKRDYKINEILGE